MVQLACREEDAPQVRQQLVAHFPEAVLTTQASPLAKLWKLGDADETIVVDFGLSAEFMRPLRTFKAFKPDPLISLTAALSGLAEGDVGVLQVLFERARFPWAENIGRAVSDWEGRSFFADAPEMVALAKAKVSRPLFAALVRVAARSPHYGRAWDLAKVLGAGLAAFADPMSNELIPLTNEGYEDPDHEEDLLLRQSRRSGMLLNSEELASLAHLPSASVRVPSLTRETKKTKKAPTLASGHALVLGENAHAGSATSVTLSAEQRMQHAHVIGASGTGKSTLLLSMIVQDIQSGQGVAVLDPHGDLIDQVLGYVPEERMEDVVLLDPADEGHPIGFNILAAHTTLEKNLLASDLVAVFRRLSTSWGDQMTSVLGNAVLAFLESDEGGTLAELRRFLVEPEFRRTFLASVRDEEVIYYWQKQFPLLTGKPQAPVLTRLDTFLRPKPIRHMVAQRENRLDFGAIMNQGKIFLAKLAQGLIGEENAYLLGSLLVSKFHLLAMSRQELAQAERRPFYLYIDEFQNFVTPSMASILAGARKYRLGLVLAHQDLRQVSKDPDVLSAVLSNPYTRVCFRVGDADAKKLEDGLSFFDAKDLQNLGLGEAICRIERADYDFNLKTLPLPAVALAVARERREAIVRQSRERYAVPREEVEALLTRDSGEAAPPPAAERPRSRRAPAVVADASSPTPPPPAEDVVPVPPPLPGRGGPQHKYLQSLVKHLAEKRGFRVTIEKTVLEGHGHIDVALERPGCSVACEVSVTTRVEHEVQNLTKCLAAGFDYAVLVCSDERMLEAVRSLLVGVGEERLLFLVPEGLTAFLDQMAASSGPSTPDMVPTPGGGLRVSPEAKKRLLIAKDAASYIGLAQQTLAKMRVTGDSPPFYKVGRQVLYDRADLDNWLAERRRRSTSDPG